MKLSILIPVYNEKNVSEILSRVESVDLGKVEKEIIIVDDGSTDGTRETLKMLNKHKIIFHDKNMGKGAAVRTALNNSTGDIIIIQDADLEYNPEEYPQLIEPIISGKADVVYGSRLLKKNFHRGKLAFYLGGRLVTFVTNLLFASNLTDEPTCYKVFRSSIIKKINIESNRFDWEPEVTAKLLKQKVEIFEVPISYNPRTSKQGKKIKWKDGISAIWTLIKWRFKNGS